MNTIIKTFIQSPYTHQSFKDFIKTIFTDAKLVATLEEKISSDTKKIKKFVKFLSQPIVFEKTKELHIYAFEVDSINAKIGIHQELATIASNIEADAILACFYDKNNRDSFRLSLITIGWDNQTKKEKCSNLKRQSFMLGVAQKINTPKENLEKLCIEWQSSPTQATLSEAFSVEPVTKAFFESYKALYDEKLTFLSKDQAIVNIFAKAYPQEDPLKAISTFIKKLLGRIVFLYFIQKKGWLGVPKDGKWGEGDKKFLKNLYDNHNSGFYEKALAPLFFESLNKDRRDDGDYSPIFDCRIPFLNGGLFEENGIDRDKMLCELLDKEFFADIFELFELYNFTIDESTPSEIEVGIDPEMLGKVFENLIDYNKELGAFYTRRGIVHFMCKNSLVLKLTQVFGDENKEH